MKKNTKKKVFTLMLVIMLLSIAIVGGSLAWFTAEDQVTNTFTVGSVEIIQHETGKNGGEFSQGQKLTPIVNTETPSEDPSYITKTVWVENTGKNDAYIRTWIAIPKELEKCLVLDTNTEDGWELQWLPPYPTIDGIEYLCYCYVYNNTLSARSKSPVLLNGVYLDPKVDVQRNDNGKLVFCYRDENNQMVFTDFEVTDATDNVKIIVATQAVQKEGFRDAKHALNEAFGEPIYDASVPFVN